MPPNKPALRSMASQILGEVLSKNKFAADRLDHHFRLHSLDPRDKALTTQLVYGVLRNKAFLDHVLFAYLSPQKTAPALQNLLRVGAYQILFLEKVPPHAILFEAVEQAKKRWGGASGKFVNAVLRRVLEGKEKIWEEASSPDPVSVEDLAWRLSLPPWLLKKWNSRYSSDQLGRLAEFFNSVPPLYLRVNLKKTSVVQVSSAFEAEGLTASAVSGLPMIKINKAPEAALEPLLRRGWVSIQDLGSYRVLQSLQAVAGEVGLDACAGHGGKSSGIAEGLPEDSLPYVHEPSSVKRKELEGNFRRLGLPSPRWLSGASEAREKNLAFDWILIDAPCSGTGTLGRRPEIRWRLQPGDIKRQQKLQREILEEWLPVLKPGGRLSYAVCSLETEEGRGLIESLLAAHPELSAIQSEEFFPPDCGHDGFFLARLEKNQDLRA